MRLERDEPCAGESRRSFSSSRSEGVAPSAPPRADIWKEFSGDKAFEHARRQVEIGPRPSGSAELERARVLIEQALRGFGWEVQRQTFADETPRGKIEFTNLIARFSPAGARPVSPKTQQVLVCSHYDTKRFSTIRFVGAEVRRSTRDLVVEAIYENKGHTLRPGMFATAKLSVGEEKGLVIPKTAVKMEGATRRVFV